MLALAACHDASADLTRVEKAWVRLPAIPDRPGAAYLTIRAGAEPARLVAVDTPAAGSSELHRSMGAGGMMAMDRVDGVDIGAGATLTLAPGGYHAMLFALDRRLKPGDRVPITVRFARGQPIAVSAKAVGVGDEPPS
jgi:hypothetical protein